LEAMDNSTLN